MFCIARPSDFGEPHFIVDGFTGNDGAAQAGTGQRAEVSDAFISEVVHQVSGARRRGPRVGGFLQASEQDPAAPSGAAAAAALAQAMRTHIPPGWGSPETAVGAAHDRLDAVAEEDDLGEEGRHAHWVELVQYYQSLLGGAPQPGAEWPRLAAAFPARAQCGSGLRQTIMCRR